MTKLVKVGVMPGRVSEVAVEEGMKVSDVLALAELSPAGYQVKMDGEVVNGDAVITSTTSLILLSKQIKGNADVVVKVGIMPGRITEFVASSDDTVADLLGMAELSASGYQIKLDGTVVSKDTVIGENAKLILLSKQIKGN